VQDPANNVCNKTVGREGTVTSFVSQDPEASERQASKAGEDKVTEDGLSVAIAIVLDSIIKPQGCRQ
jgi:hypothetical protein